jgi:hypothetical protein
MVAFAVDKDFRVKNGLSVVSTATILSTATSTSTSTGALQVAGGVGIGGNLYVGGNIYGTITTSTLATTATFATIASQVQTVAAQVSSSVHYPTFVSANNLSATGMSVYTTSNFAIQPNTGNICIGHRFPYNWTTTYKVVQLGLLWGDFYGSDSGRAGIATNLYHDGTQWINKATNVFGPSPLYEQNAAGATFTWYTSTGTLGTTATLTTLQILDPSGLTVGYTSNSINLLGAKFAVNGGARINGILTATTSTIIGTTVATSTQTGALQVAGGVGIGGKLYVGGLANSTSSYIVYINTSTGELSYGVNSGGLSNPYSGIFTITNTTSATSTITGALQVAGGIGIGGNLYASRVYANGTQLLPTSIQEFTASAGQTIFTVSGGYASGQLLVYANGVLLGTGDYTASDNSTVVLSTARRVNDLIKVVVGQNYNVNAQQAYIFTEVVASISSQTTFTANYNTATVQIFVDGVLRSPTAYTATDSTTIVLSTGSGIVNGTRIGVLSFNSVSISGALSLSGGTINGSLNITGTIQKNGVDITALSIAMSAALGS